MPLLADPCVLIASVGMTQLCSEPGSMREEIRVDDPRSGAQVSILNGPRGS
jgi:hypothetical protein